MSSDLVMEDLLMDQGDLLADWSANLSRETSPDGAGRDPAAPEGGGGREQVVSSAWKRLQRP